jgi:RNA polymerase sigma-70 factor, ECF subfamily
MSATTKQSLPELGTEEFTALVQNQDPHAVELLVRKYTTPLVKGALGMGFDAVRAEELVQSVWATFFEVAPRFQGRSQLKTFIFGILFNKASEARREKKKQETTEPIEDYMDHRFALDGHWVSAPIDPVKFLEASETLETIQKCLDTLPLNQRMAFSLKEIDDLETNEICNILGVSATNLGVLLFRSKNRLRECIEGKVKKTGS